MILKPSFGEKSNGVAIKIANRVEIPFATVHPFNYSGLLARFISKIGSKNVFLRRFY